MTAGPWKFYEISVKGLPPYVLTAATRGKALYIAYLRYSECWDCTFAQFLKLASVRPGDQPADDGYGYIRRAYGLDPTIGQRARIRDEGPGDNGREVIVIYPNRSTTAYVHCVDDEGRPRIHHPRSIELLPLDDDGDRRSG